MRKLRVQSRTVCLAGPRRAVSLTAQGNVRHRLGTPDRDGTTDVMLEPLDLMARVAALVPTPRVTLTRYPACSRGITDCGKASERVTAFGKRTPSSRETAMGRCTCCDATLYEYRDRHGRAYDESSQSKLLIRERRRRMRLLRACSCRREEIP